MCVQRGRCRRDKRRSLVLCRSHSQAPSRLLPGGGGRWRAGWTAGGVGAVGGGRGVDGMGRGGAGVVDEVCCVARLEGRGGDGRSLAGGAGRGERMGWEVVRRVRSREQGLVQMLHGRLDVETEGRHGSHDRARSSSFKPCFDSGGREGTETARRCNPSFKPCLDSGGTETARR